MTPPPSLDPALSYAPWTLDEVRSLQEFQVSGRFHEFTCGAGHGALLATSDGWICWRADCAYRQAWARRWMTDGSWRVPGSIDVARLLAALPAELNDPGVDRWGGANLAPAADDADDADDAAAQAELWRLLGLEPRPPTYARFLAAVLRTLVDPGAAEWRVGQAVFNVLAAQRPDLADRLRALDVDPCYHDARLPHALRWLEVSWDAREDQEDQPTDRPR